MKITANALSRSTGIDHTLYDDELPVHRFRRHGDGVLIKFATAKLHLTGEYRAAIELTADDIAALQAVLARPD